jgi:hypothetical protein
MATELITIKDRALLRWYGFEPDNALISYAGTYQEWVEMWRTIYFTRKEQEAKR